MHSVYCVHESGGDGIIIETQTHLSNGLPGIQLIGAVGKSLYESKDRVRSAFSSSKITMPRKKITVNLSPSDIPKNGSHYDVSIAVSILGASQNIKKIEDHVIFLGELSLDGKIKPVRGVIGKILGAKKHRYRHFVIPKSNLPQALLIPGINVVGADKLSSLVKKLAAGTLQFTHTGSGAPIKILRGKTDVDFSDVIGQYPAKRALEIAAAGQHNVLLSGPPGVGKSMLAKALLGIMPPLSRDEVITVSHLHSLVGSNLSALTTRRPLRSPHHSSSDVAIIGGGSQPKPGEITLSHTGVLFLDELPEFKRSTIESLRQPLEDKEVTVSRAKDTITYPADFLLIATKNPCPCGYYGSSKPCTCTPLEISRYQKKLSGPLLDRIDIHVTVDSVNHEKLLVKQPSKTAEQSESIQKRIEDITEIQSGRFNQSSKRNGNMNNRDIKKYAKLTDDAKELLDTAAKKLNLSARVYMKAVKVARTIADLDRSDTIEAGHISEAIRYRPLAN